MRILVYEYVSGGGFSGEPLPSGVLSEGYGMLRTVCSDFQNAGHRVTVLLDSRVARFHSPIEAENVVNVTCKGEAEKIFLEQIVKSDAVFMIAPETNGTLQRLVRHVEDMGVLSLNCSSGAIGKVSNKAELLSTAQTYGLRVPKTALADAQSGLGSIMKGLSYPVVVKPKDGVGCAGLSLINHREILQPAVDKVLQESPDSSFVVQEFVAGVPVSVSLIANGTEAMPVSLNMQDITLATPAKNSSYNGGFVPYRNRLRTEAFTAAKKIIELIEGLKGYVGVDMVLSSDSPVILEINPRLTTSYVGLREVVSFNVGQAIVDAASDGELPSNFFFDGCCAFSKVALNSSSTENATKMHSQEAVVSPPFTLPGGHPPIALVKSLGQTKVEAVAELRRIKKQLKAFLL